MSKLTLGSLLIAPTSLFPLWYDGLLEDGVHLLRVRPDASDLPRALRWLGATTIGRRRLWQSIAIGEASS